MEQLRFIQQTMEQSAAFTAVSGWGLILMGASALVAAALTAKFWTPWHEPATWMYVWIVEAVLAVTIGVATSYRKAMRNRSPLVSGPARRVALGLFPAVLTAAALTPLFYRAGLVEHLPGMWMLLYGAGLIAGGVSSTAPLVAMGASFMAAGILALITRLAGANAAMALTFGCIHIFFGAEMVRRNDG